MTVLISLFTLWLFHLVSCQIESQEDAIRIACDFTVDGLSGDTKCALASARGMLVSNGIPQTLSAANLNQLCGSTACAQLLEITPMCLGSTQDERIRAVNVKCIHNSYSLLI